MILFKRQRYSIINSSPKEQKHVKITPGTFEKCEECSECVHKDIWQKNLNVCPNCSHHRMMTAMQRVKMLIDDSTFQEIDNDLCTLDILSFKDKMVSYSEKYEDKRLSTGINEAVICGIGKMNNIEIALGIMDFNFLGGSMGSVVGEKITRLIELATNESLPLIIVTASGGARMYEGIFSLMQMAKTSGAINLYYKLNLPYIVVMTNPTTGGVMASFASLGNIIIAEPKALIGFAGPRVIKNTTLSTLPKGFQRSEFLLKKGLIDRIVDRRNLKSELSKIISYFKDVHIN